MESGSERNQELLFQELHSRWSKENRLAVGKSAIIPRGEYGEEGLDVFLIQKYYSKNSTITVTKDNLIKKLDLSIVNNLNNPVKTLAEWHSWYLKTTHKTPPIDLLINRNQLMNVNEFNKKFISRQSTDPLWTQVSSQFSENYNRLALPEKMREVSSAPLQPGELPIDSSCNRGRRVIVAGEEGSLYIFQGRSFGTSPENQADHEHWRAYLQVEIEDIPEMVEILNKIGQDMSSHNETLDFKFLTATCSDISQGINTGKYPNLKDGDPRVVLYFSDQNKRTEVLRRLSTEYYDQMLSMSINRQDKARRPGSSVFYDGRTGKEFRHINLLDQAGYSENVAQNKDWRSNARGSRTTNITYDINTI